MRVKCRGCSAKFRVDDAHGGKWGVCCMCRQRTMLPIPDPERLIAWACKVPWSKLSRFIRANGARGHSREIITDLVRVVESRRWAEEERERQQRRLSKSERGAQRDSQRRTLAELRELSPYEFEQLVAELFCMQGYRAVAVGQPADNGIDVTIRTQSGEKWAVAQCKRYGSRTKVGAMEIRDFGGAYALSGALHGFFFTTGTLTRHARKTAKGFPWLTVYTGDALVTYIEGIRRQFEPKSEVPDRVAGPPEWTC